MYNKNINEVIEHEKVHWDDVFNTELKKGTFIKFSSYWWEDYYNQLSTLIKNLLSKKNNVQILEAGSGSGKASLLLPIKANIHLVDISKPALQYAQYLKEKLSVKNNVTYVTGDILDLPYDNQKFDLCWGIGVIEHYQKDAIKQIIKEMIRVTKHDGYVVVAVPNKYSGPTIKAWLLKFKIFNFVPGYRLDTEKFYRDSEIFKIIHDALLESSRTSAQEKIYYCGNPLIMETPKILLKIFGPVINFVFIKNRFLKLYSIKLD